MHSDPPHCSCFRSIASSSSECKWRFEHFSSACLLFGWNCPLFVDMAFLIRDEVSFRTTSPTKQDVAKCEKVLKRPVKRPQTRVFPGEPPPTQITLKFSGLLDQLSSTALSTWKRFC